MRTAVRMSVMQLNNDDIGENVFVIGLLQIKVVSQNY